jgi:hypothetical protein
MGEGTKITKEEMLIEEIRNVVANFEKDSAIAKGIARDRAERVAELISSTSEEGIKKRDSAHMDFQRWRERSEVFAQAAKELKKILIPH